MNGTQDDLIELDAQIAELVFGWKFAKPRHGNCCTCQRCGRDHESCLYGISCDFSADMDGAWPVVENLRERGFQIRIESEFGLFEWAVTVGKSGQNSCFVRPSASLAICLATVERLKRRRIPNEKE